MIQYYTALGRYELRTNDRGEKHPVLISSRQEYAPDLCEMLLWSSPQFANRFVTKHKKTQAFTDFFRVSFSSIQKGFIAKITSFFAF